MSERLSQAFADAKKQGRPAFVAYLMAGYQTREATVPTMLGLQQGGADVIELGIPFTDPIADGYALARFELVLIVCSPTIQVANQKALENKVTMGDCLGFVREARAVCFCNLHSLAYIE